MIGFLWLIWYGLLELCEMVADDGVDILCLYGDFWDDRWVLIYGPSSKAVLTNAAAQLGMGVDIWTVDSSVMTITLMVCLPIHLPIFN